MAKSSVVLGLILFGLLALSSACVAEEEKEGQDEKVALNQVPAVVLKAAQDAVKGIVLTEAEKETKGADVVYELKGKVGAKVYEIKVSAAGKVLKVEEENCDMEDKDEGEAKKTGK